MRPNFHDAALWRAVLDTHSSVPRRDTAAPSNAAVHPDATALPTRSQTTSDGERSAVRPQRLSVDSQ
eukprot:5459490-Pleurochrysis_carterae.AAC.2